MLKHLEDADDLKSMRKVANERNIPGEWQKRGCERKHNIYSVGVKSTALRELKELPANVRKRTIEVIDKLELNPRQSGCKKLTGSDNRWRIRIEDHRILYEISNTSRSIVIFRVSHRKTAYR